MFFAKTIISSLIALACVAAPATAFARADGWYALDTSGVPTALPNGTMPLERTFVTNDQTVYACFSKDDGWQRCGNFRDPKAYQAGREVKKSVSASRANASECGQAPNPVRYAAPGLSPADLCNPTQVDRRYALAPNAICNHTVNDVQTCAWNLVGSQSSAPAPVQVVVQAPVLCPLGYREFYPGASYCINDYTQFVWDMGRAIYVGPGSVYYRYGYGYSSFGYRYYNYSRGYSNHRSSHDAPSVCSNGDYRRNGGRAVGRCQ